MNTSVLMFASSDSGPVIGFLVVLALLIWILKNGTPRREIPIAKPDPPHFPPDSPYYAEHRRKAAAAVYALHQHPSQPSQKDRVP